MSKKEFKIVVTVFRLHKKLEISAFSLHHLKAKNLSFQKPHTRYQSFYNFLCNLKNSDAVRRHMSHFLRYRYLVCDIWKLKFLAFKWHRLNVEIFNVLCNLKNCDEDLGHFWDIQWNLVRNKKRKNFIHKMSKNLYR